MTSDAKETPGQWWIPSKPEEKWLGTLTWKPGKGPRLKVTVPQAFVFFQAADTPPVIHGIDEHGNPITLLFPGRPQSHGAAVLTELVFTAGYALHGLHFAGRDAFQVHTLTLRMQHLFNWSDITGFLAEPPTTLEEIRLHYRQPQEQSFTINPDLRLDLQWGYSFSDRTGERRIRENHSIAFHSSRGLDFPKTIELINAVRGLLHFAVLEPVYPLEITASRNDLGRSVDGRFFPHEIQIWNSIIREDVESERQDGRWVFRFKDVQSDFAGFFGRWLDFSQRFGEALGCYSTTIYHRLPHSVEFLCLTQALEAYHGIRFASHEQRNFGKKVQELVEANRDQLAGLVDDPADFATTIQHNRNHYTHYNPSWRQDGRVVDGGQLFRLNEKLRLLFQMCVLRDLGIPAERFVRLRRQLASQIIEYV